MALRIKSLTTTAGYLEHAPVDFADGLTCIIGARGTCKSTLIETIRFAFNCDPQRVQIMLEETTGSGNGSDGPSCRGLVRATLGGGTARCELVDEQNGDTSTWSVERDADSPPRIFHEGVKEHADHSLLSRVEIYSQGDLQRIAQYGSLRLDLIDRPDKSKVDTLLKRRDDAARSLKELGPKIRSLRTAIETRRSEVKGLDAFRTSLVELQQQRPALSAELDTERAAFMHRKETIDCARVASQKWRDAIRQLLPLLACEDGLRDVCARLGAVGTDTAETARGILGDRAAFIGELRNRGAQPEQPLTDALDRIQAEFEEQNQRYYTLRKEQQEVNESLKKEDAIKQQVRHLELLQNELEDLLRQQQELLIERAKLRRTIEQVGDELYRLRLQQVDEINNTYSHVVLLTLHQGTQSAKYKDTVTRLLQGSRIRSQNEVADDLAEKVRTSDLVDIVEAGDAKRLAELLDRDMGQMARLVGFLVDNSALYDVEDSAFEDWLEITMFIDGVAKPISQLSKGQMATALLPLILRDAEYPLLFDQPEDDLDNRFIYETLVKHLRELGQRRQLILVTHNANIPVLGGADKVIVMSMRSPSTAEKPRHGDVDASRDAILALLEGGAEAFKMRQIKYGSLVSD